MESFSRRTFERCISRGENGYFRLKEDSKIYNQMRKHSPHRARGSIEYFDEREVPTIQVLCRTVWLERVASNPDMVIDYIEDNGLDDTVEVREMVSNLLLGTPPNPSPVSEEEGSVILLKIPMEKDFSEAGFLVKL